jgi:hypothetical protein
VAGSLISGSALLNSAIRRTDGAHLCGKFGSSVYKSGKLAINQLRGMGFNVCSNSTNEHVEWRLLFRCKEDAFFEVIRVFSARVETSKPPDGGLVKHRVDVDDGSRDGRAVRITRLASFAICTRIHRRRSGFLGSIHDLARQQPAQTLWTTGILERNSPRLFSRCTRASYNEELVSRALSGQASTWVLSTFSPPGGSGSVPTCFQTFEPHIFWRPLNMKEG